MSEPAVPPGVDTSVPSIARVYDAMLDGKDNFAVDRAAAQAMIDVLPPAPALAHDNRNFLRRAVTWLVGTAGIRQIIDIGSGLPTTNNIHEIASAIADDVRVVYVDNDPIVLAHGRALLADDGHSTVIQADVRAPGDIFDSPETRALIDLDEPFAVLLASVLHHFADDEDPADIAHAIAARLSSGSYLLVANFFDPGDDPRAAASEHALLEGGLGTGRFRTRAEQTPFFGDLQMVEPGLVFANDWLPDEATPTSSAVHRLYAGGIARR